jgi:hypothetical protein
VGAFGGGEPLDRRGELAKRGRHAVLAHEQPRHLHVLLVMKLFRRQRGINEPGEQV